MKTAISRYNPMLLFLCTSIYLGTGISLVMFSFPIEPQLTPSNYYMQFVPQVEAATNFFTYMTIVMIVSALLMIWTEWSTGQRWVPIAVLIGVAVSTGLTIWMIFPLNEEMSKHITDADRLKVVLAEWMSLNRVRVGLWVFQWACMMYWFYHWATRAREGI